MIKFITINPYMKRERGQPKKANKKIPLTINLVPKIQDELNSSLHDMTKLKEHPTRSLFIASLIMFYVNNRELVIAWIEENKKTIKDTI